MSVFYFVKFLYLGAIRFLLHVSHIIVYWIVSDLCSCLCETKKSKLKWNSFLCLRKFGSNAFIGLIESKHVPKTIIKLEFVTRETVFNWNSQLTFSMFFKCLIVYVCVGIDVGQDSGTRFVQYLAIFNNENLPNSIRSCLNMFTILPETK